MLSSPKEAVYEQSSSKKKSKSKVLTLEVFLENWSHRFDQLGACTAQLPHRAAFKANFWPKSVLLWSFSVLSSHKEAVYLQSSSKKKSKSKALTPAVILENWAHRFNHCNAQQCTTS